MHFGRLLYYWSGIDLIMPTVAFPLCPRVYNNLISTLESKLDFSEIQGWDQRYFTASGMAGKLNLTGHCLMAYLNIFSFVQLCSASMWTNGQNTGQLLVCFSEETVRSKFLTKEVGS